MTIFEKIIQREIVADIIYEDDDVLAFLDITQVTKGHTLVIPKKHSSSILDTDPLVLSKVMQVTQYLAVQIKNTFNAKGVNILTNANEAAGQTVFHFHVHIVPRYDELDGFDLKFHGHPQYDRKQIASDIVKSLDLNKRI